MRSLDSIDGRRLCTLIFSVTTTISKNSADKRAAGKKYITIVSFIHETARHQQYSVKRKKLGCVILWPRGQVHAS